MTNNNPWIKHLIKYKEENNVVSWFKEARKTYVTKNEKLNKSASKIQGLVKGVNYREKILPKMLENYFMKVADK